ncbi:hypothetical protein IGB42_03550 [Andreprevotia sp. IGB-42]|uniref:hypothetical protein n=1 Tax=Andreprevotia sp. IGB-42 TaxID=2497473 RepID=UPI0013569C08|nr:hypothetical protein [Andreprevotia sp. IGB-42]KAF0812008.1 hypothetical protein IGB42_03550 [Andreprevotia sp. IGB-42]
MTASIPKRLTRRQLRELKKEALQVQADAYRMQLGADWQTLRKPLQGGALVKGFFGGGPAAGLADVALTMLGGPKLGWLGRYLPMAMTGWRVANVLKVWLGKGKAPHHAEPAATPAADPSTVIPEA